MQRRIVTILLCLLTTGAILALASSASAKRNHIGYKACMDDCGKYDPHSTRFDQCADFCKCVHHKGNGNVYCSIKSTTDHPSASINQPRKKVKTKKSRRGINQKSSTRDRLRR